MFNEWLSMQEALGWIIGIGICIIMGVVCGLIIKRDK